jgi:hypothetical protein
MSTKYLQIVAPPLECFSRDRERDREKNKQRQRNEDGDGTCRMMAMMLKSDVDECRRTMSAKFLQIMAPPLECKAKRIEGEAKKQAIKQVWEGYTHLPAGKHDQRAIPLWGGCFEFLIQICVLSHGGTAGTSTSDCTKCATISGTALVLFQVVLLLVFASIMSVLVLVLVLVPLIIRTLYHY